MMTFKVARLSPDAQIPIRGSPGAAGYDLYSSADTLIPKRTWVAVPTGIALQVPGDHYARIAPRSGLALKYGIDVGAGVVDSDYTGEVKVILFNHSDEHFAIRMGDRVAQVIFEKISTPYLREVDLAELGVTTRGQNGFGSSGVETALPATVAMLPVE